MIKLIAYLLIISSFVLMQFPVSATTRAAQELSEQYNPIYYKEYHALVVGVSSYENWAALPHAVKDAKEVSEVLKRFGFKVTLLLDPTAMELKEALSSVTQGPGRDPDNGILFYYAGHGETRELADGTKLGWIIPKDCPVLDQDHQGFAEKAISMKDIEGYSMQIMSRHVLMLFDSSFSGEVFSLEPAVLGDISEESALPVRQYVIAGIEDEPVPDKSMFKKFLVKGLEGNADLIYDGIITGTELGNFLSKIVAKSTGGRQHTQYGTIKNPVLAGGDFIFQPATKISGTAVSLFVTTNPANALIRVLNIKPRFFQGMELKPGKYHLEVSSAGFWRKKMWVDIKAGEEKRLNVQLTSVKDEFANSIGMKFALINPGIFMMGSPDSKDRNNDDEKMHRVTIKDAYYMQITEVTVGQFRTFVEATGYKTQGEEKGGCWIRTKKGALKKSRKSSWKNPGSWETERNSQTSKHPVTCVSWNDARAFARWLSKKDGISYTLPREAQWENACRAGTRSPFSYGLCLSTDQANYGGLGTDFQECDSAFKTNWQMSIKVASLTPNSWGLYDMHGNVSEWCRDWYDRYPSGDATDPKGPSFGAERVMRGGHWFNMADGCRSAKRMKLKPDFASDALGFRLIIRP